MKAVSLAMGFMRFVVHLFLKKVKQATSRNDGKDIFYRFLKPKKITYI